MPEEDQKTKNDVASKPILEWESPEAVHYKQGLSWFITVSLVALALAALLYWLKQTSGAVVAVVAGAVIMIVAGAKPKVVKSAIYDDGVVVDGKAYEFNRFKSFWITQGEIAKAKLQLNGAMAGQVTMPLKGVDAEAVRSDLKKHLPEEEGRGEDLMDTINRWIKF